MNIIKKTQEKNNMDNDWLFSVQQLIVSPSRKCGVSKEKELFFLQQGAVYMEDICKRIGLGLLCMNTAVVFMQRFYVFHSHTMFDKYLIATTCVFLSSKVEEQPCKIEIIVRVAKAAKRFLTESDDKLINEIVLMESLLLQTLGFQVRIEHPHAYVIKATTILNFPKEFSRKCYMWARHILHLTTLGLIYKPTVLACASIILCSRLYKVAIPKNTKDWIYHTDQTITLEQVEKAAQCALEVLKHCPFLHSKDKEIMVNYIKENALLEGIAGKLVEDRLKRDPIEEVVDAKRFKAM